LDESFPVGDGLESMNESLLEQVTQLEEADIEAQMREGYLATLQEREELNRDWQILDGEGWPEQGEVTKTRREVTVT